MTISRWMQLSICALAAMGPVVGAARGEDVNDYPTNARVEYVFGCMVPTANPADDRSCSCSIDVRVAAAV